MRRVSHKQSMTVLVLHMSQITMMAGCTRWDSRTPRQLSSSPRLPYAIINLTQSPMQHGWLCVHTGMPMTSRKSSSRQKKNCVQLLIGVKNDPDYSVFDSYSTRKYDSRLGFNRNPSWIWAKLVLGVRLNSNVSTTLFARFRVRVRSFIWSMLDRLLDEPYSFRGLINTRFLVSDSYYHKEVERFYSSLSSRLTSSFTADL